MKTLQFLLIVAVIPCAVSCQEEVRKVPPTPTATASTAAPTVIAVATVITPTAPTAAPAIAEVALALPAQLQGKAVIVAKGDPDAARADLAAAVKVPGEGGLTQGLVVRLTADIPVWRIWSGDAKTKRLGQWWAYDAPHGTAQAYRTDYEICTSWNELTSVTKCTLKKGAVVAIGPGQSVSPKVCGDPTGKESYPANPRDWQVWVSKAWTRGQEIVCPGETSDYAADAADIAHAKKAGHVAGK